MVRTILGTNHPRDSTGIRTHSHLVHKGTLNHLAGLAKWLRVRLRTKWLWVWIPLLSSSSDIVPASSKELLDILTNYRVLTHSEAHTWHDNNMQSPSWFSKIWKLPLFYSGSFKIFENALGEFILNRPPEHVITSTNQVHCFNFVM